MVLAINIAPFSPPSLSLSLSYAAAVQTAVQERTPAAHNQRGHRGDSEGFEWGQHTPHGWPRTVCLLRGLPPLHLPPGPPHLPHQGCVSQQHPDTTAGCRAPEAAAVTTQWDYISHLWIQPQRGGTCHECAAGRGERTKWQTDVWKLWPSGVSLWTSEQSLHLSFGRCEKGICWGKASKTEWESMGGTGSLQGAQHPPSFKCRPPTATQEQLPRVTHQHQHFHPKHISKT